jgi:VWFA-related protein
MGTPAKLGRLLFIGGLLAGIAAAWRVGSALSLQNQEPSEIKSEETAPTFTVRAQRNEVLARVVVRDKDGKAVGGLTKDDFRLSDNGKPQSVTLFKVETYKAAPPAAGAAQLTEAQPSPALPQRYVAFYFDDLVVKLEDMYRVRAAADKYIDSALQPGDRAGVFTSSDLGDLDFTEDRAKLHEALTKLRPRPRMMMTEHECPPLTPYEAYLIDELRDPLMIQIAAREYVACACLGDVARCPSADNAVQAAARFIWQTDQDQSRQSLQVLENVVRRLSALPGQRSVLWLSQGFLARTLQAEVDRIIDRALREHVVISALDARGLWVDTPTISVSRTAGKEMNDDVMANVAHDTGGAFVYNNNDYDGGFRLAGALPEVSYLLAFSPQNLKYDGKFHKLKVQLANAQGLSVQARNGYFAPNQELRPEEGAKQEIDDAVFALEEYLEFPVEVHTQFFKLSDTKTQLAILTRIDAHALRFHKEGDRNRLSLKLVCVAFDRDGKFVDGTERNVELRLHDATLAHVLNTGLKLRGQLKVGSGTYALRVVVYELDSARMTALNLTVEIPY